MGTTLTGNKIKDTYKSLVKLSDSGEAGTSGKQLSDGNGNDLGLFIDTDGVFGIGASATFSLDVSSKTDGIAFPVGTTANRPTGSAGIVRYNATNSKLEYYSSDFKIIASESYVNTQVTTAITNLIDGAPATLDTLNELAAALNDDDAFHTTITNLIATKQATITGAATTITGSDLTASKALVSNSSGKVAVSAVTDTELGYVAGVTSAIQTQIDTKHPTITGAATTITTNDLTASKAVISNASGKIAASSVTDTELGYVSGVTSAIQTQVDAKQDTLTAGDGIDINSGTDTISIAAGAITSDLIDTGAIVAGLIASGAVGTLKLEDNSVTNAKLADDAVDSPEIVDGAIDTIHIADDQITAAKLADTSVTPGTYGDATNSAQIIIDQQGRITSASNVSISGGGGGGSTTIVSEQFNGNNSTTAFTLSNTIASENNTQIYIDGVYQSKANYSTSGQIITFSTAPPTGTANIQVTHFVAIGGTPAVEIDTYNGDNSTTAFTLTTEPATKNNLQIYIDGVYQAKANYSTSGTALTFTTAPPTGTNNIEITHIKLS